MQNPPPPNQGGYGYQYGAPPPPPPSGTPPGGGGGKTTLGGLDENVAAMLCYLTMFCCLGVIVSIVFFVTEKTSRLVRFSAIQSLLIGAVGIAIAIAFWIMSIVLALAHVGILSLLLWVVEMVIFLGLAVLLVVAAIKAYQNQTFKVPVLGGIAENIAK